MTECSKYKGRLGGLRIFVAVIGFSPCTARQSYQKAVQESFKSKPTSLVFASLFLNICLVNFAKQKRAASVYK